MLLIRAELADSVIRCLPGEDKTNGFFVACLVRGAVQASDDTTKPVTEKGVQSKRKRAPEQKVAAEIANIAADEKEDETEDESEDEAANNAANEPGEAAAAEPKPKSVAQLERARRKKQNQQQRKKQKTSST